MSAGAVKSSRALQTAYGHAIEHLATLAPTEASIVRQYIAELREEAGHWRILYRTLQAEKAGER